MIEKALSVSIWADNCIKNQRIVVISIRHPLGLIQVQYKDCMLPDINLGVSREVPSLNPLTKFLAA